MAIAERAAVAPSAAAAVPGKRRRRWLLAIFGLPFAGAGLAVLVFAVVPMLADGWSAQSWVRSEARLTSAGLDAEHGSETTTWRARATYTYRYGGREYRGNRVALGTGGDNIGHFQQDLGRRLIRARETGQPVPVWINPEDPAEAVLNREFRWGLVALMLSLGVVFTGTGSTLVWLGFRSRARRGAEGAAAEKPWLLRSEWTTPEIASNARRGLKLAWAFTFLWNLVAIPAGVAFTFAFLDGNKPAAFGLLFPLVGAGIVAYAIRRTLAWRRFGPAPLVMDPYPGAIGGQVGGTVDVRLPYDPQLKFRTSVTCVYSYMSGTGKNRSRHERVVWQTDGVAHTVPRLEHTRLEILFDVDSGLPAPDSKEESDYHLWRLHVEADLPGIDFERSFEIPVFATGQSSRELRRLSTEHRAAAEERARAIKRVLDVRPVPGGIELIYPPFRYPLIKVLGFVFGSVFLGVGVLLTDAPITLRVIFGVLGAAMALASLYNLLVSLRVRIDRSRLEIRRRLLGLPAGGESIPRVEISRLALKQSFTHSSGGKHTVYFKLQALASGGRAVTIGHNLAGRETAKQVLEELSELTGIPVDEAVEGNVLG